MKESTKKAIDKYEKKVKLFTVRIDIQIIDQITEYCRQQKMTKKKFIENAVLEYIDRH